MARTSPRWFAVILTAFACATPGLLSQQKGGPGGGFGGFKASYTSMIYWAPTNELITHDEVLAELKLDAKQREAVRKALAAYEQKSVKKGVRGKVGEAPALTEADKKLNEALTAALGEKKFKRLDQIAAQGAGLAAFVTRVDLHEQLAITADQLTKAKTILLTTRKEVTGTGKNLTAVGVKGAENRTIFAEQATPKLVQLLTEDQKKRWQDIVGEPVAGATLVKVRTSPGFDRFGPFDGSPFGTSPALRLSASQRAYSAGRYLEAENLARLALDGFKEPNAQRGDALLGLGAALYKLDRFKDAEPYFTEALSLFEKLHGPYHPKIADALGWLGHTARIRKQYDQAEKHQRKVIDLREKVDGPHSVAAANAWAALGHTLLAQKQFKQAEECYRKELAIQDKIGDKVTVGTAALHNLAAVYRDMGKTKEAEDHALRAIELLRQANPSHTDLRFPLALLTKMYIQQKRWKDAEPHALECLRIMDKGRMEGPHMVAALDNLAAILTATDRKDEAAVLLQRRQELQARLSAKPAAMP